MDSNKFNAAIEAAMVDEIGKVNSLLPMRDVKNMMKIRAVVERFIDEVKKLPEGERTGTYPGINWGDFKLISVEKVMPLSGDHYYAVLCEEGQCQPLVHAINIEVRAKLGVDIEVRIEW